MSAKQGRRRRRPALKRDVVIDPALPAAASAGSLRARVHPDAGFLLVLALLALGYGALAWLVSGPGDWWRLDWVDHFTIFTGDDAYRFFLARSAWVEGDTFFFNFVMPFALILEALVAGISMGDILVARLLHLLPAMATVWFAYKTLRQMTAPAWLAGGSAMVLALMPLFALVSLSFYGEMWLALGVAGALHAMASGRLAWLAAIGAVLPLLRPEGAGYSAAIGLFLLLRKQWGLIVVLVAPSLFYAVLIATVSTGGVAGYSQWRWELLRVLNRIAGNPHPLAILNTLNLYWYAVGFAAALLPVARRLWPLSLAAFLWALALLVSAYTGKSFYEPRYLLSLLPVLAVLWGLAFLQVLRWWQGTGARATVAVVFVATSLFVATDHLLQLDPLARVNAWHRMHGEWPDFEGHRPVDVLFGGFSAAEIAQRREAADLLVRLANEYPQVDRIIVGDVYLLYFLDPAALPERVGVGYPAAFWPVFKYLLDGQLMAVFPDGDRYAYYTLRDAPAPGAGRALLYADLLGKADHPQRWEIGAHEIYLFGYEASRVPAVDIDSRPPLDPATLPRHEALRR